MGPPGVDAAALPAAEAAAETAAVPAVPKLEYRAEPVKTLQSQSPPEDVAASAVASAPDAVGPPGCNLPIRLPNSTLLGSDVVQASGRARLALMGMNTSARDGAQALNRKHTHCRTAELVAGSTTKSAQANTAAEPSPSPRSPPRTCLSPTQSPCCLVSGDR